MWIDGVCHDGHCSTTQVWRWVPKQGSGFTCFLYNCPVPSTIVQACSSSSDSLSETVHNCA